MSTIFATREVVRTVDVCSLIAFISVNCDDDKSSFKPWGAYLISRLIDGGWSISDAAGLISNLILIFILKFVSNKRHSQLQRHFK